MVSLIRYDRLWEPILILIYNVIFGGVLGVAGSIYYLVGIRNFVMKNEGEFKSLEIQA